MKNLTLISFVGVDTQTNLDTVIDFKSHIPCEFSVLFSDSKSVGNYTRYPSYKFCKYFLDLSKTKPFKGSLHLCGSVIDRYLKQEQDVLDLCKNAVRIQLNLNIANYPNHEKLTNDILDIVSKHGHKVILQQNKTKEKFMKTFMKKNTSSISLLHDSSGGFGREITKVDAPNSKHFTGYAGGINPGNVAKIVKLIEDINWKETPYYIDMESGIRIDNVFSIDKCKEVIANLL